ncbi:MAG: hypothetical protein WD894_18830 [Pirellulales bacterium]
METNKQNRFIDVMESPFNAAGDGETDDAPAFQRAVGALKGVEGKVEQPPNPKDELRS